MVRCLNGNGTEMFPELMGRSLFMLESVERPHGVLRRDATIASGEGSGEIQPSHRRQAIIPNVSCKPFLGRQA